VDPVLNAVLRGLGTLSSYLRGQLVRLTASDETLAKYNEALAEAEVAVAQMQSDSGTSSQVRSPAGTVPDAASLTNAPPSASAVLVAFETAAASKSDGGLLSASELPSALQRLGIVHNPAESKKLLLHYDADGNASLDLSEFHRLVLVESAFASARSTCNPYTTTLHAINSGIIKLGKLTHATKVYRGVGGMTLPPAFWQKNEFGVMGGCENAFMSTTTNRSVATGYASGYGMGLVFEIKQGMIDRGADISWLSFYPHEKEILFGPLTVRDARG
jgi:hypothetical protein